VRPSGFPDSGVLTQTLKPWVFSGPALKRMIKIELFSATLKRCFPLLKQRDPTNIRGLFA
jgi:hypothetical protein